MHTQLHQEETSTHVSVEGQSDAGEQLEAGLEADQAERARLEAKWEAKMRRFDAAQKLFDRGTQNWFKKLIGLFGGSLLYWALTFPFQDVHDILTISRYLLPLLAGCFVFVWAGISIFGNWALDRIFPIIRRAAHNEGVEIHGPSVKSQRNQSVSKL